MLQITKQGNSIVVEGLNHYFYPYNGTLEVPCNSVITVVDEGNIVLFRSASNYDVLFSAKIDEITINGQSVTKDNVGEVFGALSNVSSGGLTPEQEEKLNNALQSETDPIWTAEKGNYYTKTEIDTSLEVKANKTEIPSLNGYATEQWVGEQGYLTEHQPLKTINGESIIGNGDIVISGGGEETDPVWTAEKTNYYTKSEIDGIVGNVNNALSEIING